MSLRWVAALSVAGVIGLAATLAIGDEHYEHERGWMAALAGQGGVKPVENALYVSECGDCHFAYPPGLLPERSWRRLMDGLSQHFGENAELAPELQQQLTAYLAANAAERDPGSVAQGIARSVAAETTPTRITETRYFIRQHDELPARVWRDNPEVGSLSNCVACHSKADSGSFDEHQVVIPGIGAWDD